MTHSDFSIITVNGKTPTIHPSAFIAPGCRIIGDVTIGPDVSIWYNCVLRADVSHIIVGARSNIQDGSIVHCDGPMPHSPEGFPTIIGEDVLIGHMAMVHGCTLADRAFVGLKATVMNGCRIGSDAMLAAGALLTENKEIPDRERTTAQDGGGGLITKPTDNPVRVVRSRGTRRLRSTSLDTNGK